MRPTLIRLAQQANKAPKKGIKVPVEIYPLFFAMGLAGCSALYFSTKKFTHGDLRLTRQGKKAEHAEGEEKH
ncbi:hypothetical protein B0I72DRAFT_135464 [Yarrowia lipolytica]|uniref:Uncharacterized protein n=1 Tax=Yarrowia lipolytica TaxID=4952 RepID=A0A1H6PSV1_YARLL|nr:hypothetical protein YALI1_F02289g [Yarrowia lipolytica]KAB8280317.1 hypothetical protein BKA91DRAFT_142130 [Yarrowia lipolytica]KAE8169474.1 hypothetical protein BKA90DRAFT_142539 [Yarrowia lipolytica]KAJ8056257.1 hypothetical protein LXG23DRAFT_57788 [Yarrowia lipolytica]QNQ00479.1 UPF0495 protein [Yarrowia lipolytica]